MPAQAFVIPPEHVRAAAAQLLAHGVPLPGGANMRHAELRAACGRFGAWPTAPQCAGIVLKLLEGGTDEDQRRVLVDRLWIDQVHQSLAAASSTHGAALPKLRACVSERDNDNHLAAAAQAAAAATAAAAAAIRVEKAAAAEERAAKAIATAAKDAKVALDAALAALGHLEAGWLAADIAAAAKTVTEHAEPAAGAAHALHALADERWKAADAESQRAKDADKPAKRKARELQERHGRLHGQLIWIMLAALHRIAPLDCTADFVNAAGRLCPGLPTDPKSGLHPELAAARDELADALTDGRVRLPAPWGGRPRDMQTPQAAYLGYLASIYREPKQWLGQRFVDALNLWFGAIHDPPDAGRAARGAGPTLTCLGSSRKVSSNWSSGEFFDAAHAWCVGQWATTQDADWRGILDEHLNAWTDVALVLRGMAWLTGVHDGAPLPGREWADFVSQTKNLAKRGRKGWFDDLLDRLQEIADDRRSKPGADFLSFVRYQPPGDGVLAVSDDQMTAMTAKLVAPGGVVLLGALHLIHILHAQIGLIPTRVLHPSASEYFYKPIADALKRVIANARCCALRTPDPVPIALALRSTWLAGGRGVCLSDVALLPDCFNPASVKRTPAPDDLEASFPGIGFHGLRRQALLLLDLLCNPMHAAAGTGGFGRETWSYLEGKLRTSRDDAQLLEDPVLNEVRQTHWRLIRELAQLNLQHRVRRAFDLLGCGPAADGCPVCRH